jgi:hypothetical protein
MVPPIAATETADREPKDENTMNTTMDKTSRDLDSQIDAIGWGLFFLMSGVVLLVPDLPDGSWLTGLGALFLGLSIVRRWIGLPVSGFGVVVGIVAIAAGASTIAGVSLPVFALLLVGCGLVLVTRELTPHFRG